MNLRYLRQVGLNIRSMRERCGLRQIDVQEKTGLNHRHYQNIEAGKVNVTVETLCKLAKLFRVKIEELVKDVCS
ncbi:MAG: helix-turn-helix transcriptional regulator [Bdellovibrionota bacterium]